MLNFAIQTARDAGRVLAERLGRVTQVSHKSEIELLTEVDLASERLIIDRIKTHYPRHSILAEESGETKVAENLRYGAKGHLRLGVAHIIEIAKG